MRQNHLMDPWSTTACDWVQCLNSKSVFLWFWTVHQWQDFSEMTTVRSPILHTVLTMWVWHSSHDEKGSMCPFLESGHTCDHSGSSTLWLLRVGHKRWYNLGLVLLDCFLWEPKHQAPRKPTLLCGEATWRGTASTNVPAMWVSPLEWESSSSSRVTPVDAAGNRRELILIIPTQLPKWNKANHYHWIKPLIWGGFLDNNR